MAITTTQQLGLYNGALTKLASLTVNEEAQWLLTDVWNDGNGAVCLEEGLWFFATRTSMLGYDPTITPSFGYAFAFEKPADWAAAAAAETRPPYFWVGTDAESAADAEPAEPVVNLPVTIRNQDLHHSELTIVRRFDSGAEIVIATVAPGDFYAAIVWDGCELVIRANG